MPENGRNVLASGTDYVADSWVVNFNLMLGPNQFMVFPRIVEISLGASINVGPGAIVEVT